MLITAEADPRVMGVTVLTNALLIPNQELIEDFCGGCSECVDACPVGAFTGVPFHADEPREVRYDAAKCENI